MRRLGCLLVMLVVVAAVLFIADQALTTLVERRTADQLTRDFGAAASVDLQGWPVTARMLGGTVPRADVTFDDLELDNGAVLDRLDVVLTDVVVSFGQLTGSEPQLPPADEGTFRAQLDETSVAGLLGVPESIVQVELRAGLVQLSAAGIEVDAAVEASDGDVALSLQGPLAQLLQTGAFTIDLSQEPGAPYVEQVEIGDGVLVVEGRLEEVGR